MKKELNKKLRDAGFPLKPHNLGALHMDGYTPAVGPDLAELIEACINSPEYDYKKGSGKIGDEFYLIREEDGTWETGFRFWDIDSQMFSEDHESEGQTPEEAVAELWLKLNP